MPKPTIMRFKDKLQEKLFVINVNLKRRHLTNFQQIELALKRKPILEEIARRNQKAVASLYLKFLFVSIFFQYEREDARYI
jgi:hypothetical protein